MHDNHDSDASAFQTGSSSLNVDLKFAAGPEEPPSSYRSRTGGLIFPAASSATRIGTGWRKPGSSHISVRLSFHDVRPNRNLRFVRPNRYLQVAKMSRSRENTLVLFGQCVYEQYECLSDINLCTNTMNAYLISNDTSFTDVDGTLTDPRKVRVFVCNLERYY